MAFKKSGPLLVLALLTVCTFSCRETRQPAKITAESADGAAETAAVTDGPAAGKEGKNMESEKLRTDGFILEFTEKDGVYTAQSGVCRTGGNPPVFGETFTGKTVSLAGIVFETEGSGPAAVIEADHFKLTDLVFSGSGTGIECRGSDAAIENCSFTGCEAAAVLLSGGERISVTGCIFGGPGPALSDGSDGNVLFENNTVSGCGDIAVIISSPYSRVTGNTISGAAVSLSVFTGNSPAENALVDRNRTDGEIRLTGADNAVVFGNDCAAVTVFSCRDLTAAGNTLPESGKISLSGVSRALVTGNTRGSRVPEVVRANSTHVYGGDIPEEGDIPLAGADESRLPSVSPARFKDMQVRNLIPSGGKTVTADYYITKLIEKGGKVIIPPGVYSLTSPLYIADTEGLEVYAYGALFVYKDSSKQALSLRNSKNIAFRGLTVDFASVPNAQGTVLSADNGKIIWKGDEGYGFDLTDKTRFTPEAAAEGFRKGSLLPFCDLYGMNKNTIKNADGTFTLDSAAALDPGDKLTFRGNFAHVIYAEGCSGVLLEDVTLWGGSGFGFCEVAGEGGSLLSRVLMTPGPKPEGASTERMLSVCDATHCTNMRRGITVRDCLFEYMTDDGTNVNGTYGLINGYERKSGIVSYNADTMPAVLAGDRIWIMTTDGRFLLDTKAVTAGSGGKVKIAGTFTLPAGESAFIENVSANGAGFLFENTLIRGNRSRGLVIKSTNGTVTRCTIDSSGMTGLLLKPEISDNWGECGFTENVVLSRNRIVNTGYFDPGSDAQSAIAVRTDLAAPDESYFSHRNITIEGNLIEGYHGGYAVCLRGVAGASVTGNIIGQRGAAVSGPPLYLSGCDSVLVDGNSFTPLPDGIKIKTAGKVTGLSGDDILQQHQQTDL